MKISSTQQGKIKNAWHPIINYQTCKEAENRTYNEKKNKNQPETDTNVRIIKDIKRYNCIPREIKKYFELSKISKTHQNVQYTAKAVITWGLRALNAH